jgi:hypothetical protein
MEWRPSASLFTLTCWVARDPARLCLLETMKSIETLVSERQEEIWDGVNTSPGCSWDPSMLGKTVHDAQPTIIFHSSNSICRRNAKRMIKHERIVVDPRGIGIEYFELAPAFLAGPVKFEAEINTTSTLEPITSRGKDTAILDEASTGSSSKPTVNGILVDVGSVVCTIGGLIVVNNEIFGLTVAHAFEDETADPSSKSKASFALFPQISSDC